MAKLPDSTTILVVGAGPTGLATAISLIQRGCRDVVVVDAVLHGENTSRAMTLHAATLEALEQIELADTLVPLGIKGTGMKMRNRTSFLLGTDFTTLKPYTKYPYVLLIPQNIVERVLLEKLESLGCRVVRPHKVVGLKSVSGGQMEVAFDGGEVIRAKYVIGSDGARSAVRQLAGIGFADPDGLAINEGVQQMVVADVVLSPPDPEAPVDAVEATITGGGAFFIIPLPTSWSKDIAGVDPDDRVYRLGFMIPEGQGAPPHDLPIEYIQNYVDKFGPKHLSSDASANPHPVRISRKIWASRFRTHSAIADRFYTRLDPGANDDTTLGRTIFLVGDAAHIHSPAGGMGMNLGLRDAIGLGQALSDHFDAAESSPEKAREILQAYAATRHARAKTTIRLTKRILGVAVIMRSESYLDLRYWIVRLLARIPILHRMAAWRLSGLGNR